MTAIELYQTREVRDLAWACFSPPLLHSAALSGDAPDISGCRFELTDHRLAWLQSLDRDPEPLLAHLRTTGDSRLGLYFEHLWHFFLHHDPLVELVAHNLPVREGGKTLGEFDCIYFCHQRQRHVHLELAVKFYLGRAQNAARPGPSKWDQWWGPNTADRLDLKVAQLVERQIRLAEQPPARQLLRELGVSDPHREVAIKGYLFRPLAQSMAAPAGFNNRNQLHSWLRVDQLAYYLADLHSASYCLLPRLHWLSNARLEPGDRGLCSADLRAYVATHFESHGRPLLVAGMDDEGVESARFFITTNHWPQSPAPLPGTKRGARHG